MCVATAAQGQTEGTPVLASAAAPVTPEDEAKACFLRGIALAHAGGDWDAARKEFLESRRLYPTRFNTHNAAFALVQLGRLVEAAQLYDALFAEFGAQLTASQTRSFSREREALLAHIGELEISVNEPDAGIVIDGLEQAKTPITGPIKLAEGRHTLRLSKDGFVPIELVLQIAGGQHRLIQSTLNRASETGTLVVRESSARQLDVLVDSAKVGHTPWQGELSTGPHLVLLLGLGHLGTPPSSTEIRVGQTTSLTLQAVELTSFLRVEPTPTNGAVFVDDIPVGNGIWQGRLPAGIHRVDVIAAGHIAFRQEFRLTAGQSADVRARLERDAANPIWKTVRKVPLLLELNGGPVFSPSLSGSADDDCGCKDRSRPRGLLAGLRIGYLLTPRLAVELGANYLSVSESMTRNVRGQGEAYSPTFTASDYHDSTRLRGPLAQVSLSYRMLEKTPLTARLGGGVGRLTSQTQNTGSFSGDIVNSESKPEHQTVTFPVSIAEAARVLYVPFASTELRFGYRFSRVLSADIGAAVAVFFPPSTPRGGTDTAGSAEVRGIVLSTSAKWSDGRAVVPGRLTLPHETIAGPFLTLAPTVALQARF